MAVTVISRKHPSATKRVICMNCGAELEYTKSDTRTKVSTDYTGGKDTYRYLDCPECRNAINVGMELY